MVFHLEAAGGTGTVPAPVPLVCSDAGAGQTLDLGEIAAGTNLTFSTEGGDGTDFVIDITADQAVGQPQP